MIRLTQKCLKGHPYMVLKPSRYDGAAQYPQDCPQCRKRC